MDGHRLHSGKNNVLGNLHSETFHSRDEDVGGAHLTHGIVTQDIASRTKGVRKERERKRERERGGGGGGEKKLSTE